MQAQLDQSLDEAQLRHWRREAERDQALATTTTPAPVRAPAWWSDSAEVAHVDPAMVAAYQASSSREEVNADDYSL